MHVEYGPARAAFLAGLDSFADATTGLGDAQLLADSRCPGWTVCDVVVHVHHGLQEMLLGVVAPTRAAPDTDAAGYWRSGPAAADPLAGRRFVRPVSAAYRRPTDAVRHLLLTAAGLRKAVGSLAPGSVRFQGRVLSTGDFLATWAVEVAVHHLDLAGEAPSATPALLLARRTVESLAGASLPATWPAELAVLVGTGRVPLTDAWRAELGGTADRLPVLG